ncbi:hypothetical protein ACOMHN_021931 [Nucella lapillus]
MVHRIVFQVVVFFTTFFSFALFHMVRKSSSYVQSSLIKEWTPAPQHLTNGDPTWTRQSLFQDQQSAEEFIGYLNAIFLFVYAAGIVLNGMAADRLDRRLFLTVAMVLSASVMFLYGPVVEWTGGYSKGGYVVLQILNALFQSAGWPGVLSVMTSWFDKKTSGYVLGIWTSGAALGGIVGALVVSSVVGYGYEYAFLLTTSMLLAGAVVVYFGLVPSPLEVGLSMPDCNEVSYENTEFNDDGNNDCNSNSYDEDYDACPHGDRKGLLEASPYGSGVPHASYGSHGHTGPARHAAETSSSQQRFSTKMVEETTSRPGDASRLLKQSTLATCNPTGRAQTPSSGLTAEEDVEVHIEDTRADNVVKKGNKCKDQQSDFIIKSKDRENKTVKVVYGQGYGNGVSHANKMPQSKDCRDVSPEESLQNSPRQPEQHETPLKQVNDEDTHPKQKAIRFWDALLLPGVIPFSLCYVSLKLVTYVFYFWLPFYLTSARGWAEADADRLSVWIDVGGMVGSTVFVFIVSKLNKFALVMVPVLTASVPLLYGYGVLGWGQDITTITVLLFWIGVLLCGINNPLSAAVSAGINRQDSGTSNTRSAATVSGIMEGSGTVGAALGQIVVPYLFPAFGWDSVFYLLMTMSCLTAACILPLFVSEVKSVMRSWRG